MTTSPRTHVRGGRAVFAAVALVALALFAVPGTAGARTGPAAVCTPAGVDDFYNTLQGTTLNITIADDGVLGNDTLCFVGDASVVTPTAHGAVNLAADGTFSYTPDPSFFGNDSFVYQFVVDVPAGQQPVGEQVYTATANIFVSCVSDLVDDAYAGPQDTPIAVAAPGIVTNDHLCPELNVEVVTPPTSGTLTAFDGNGGFTYTPNAGFVGSDSYTYRAAFFDKGAGPNAVVVEIATVRLTINPVVTTTQPPATTTTTTTTTTVPETTTTVVDPTTTTEPPTTTTTTTAPAAVSSGGTALPRTGSDVAPVVTLGLILITLGGITLVVRRRRLA